MFSPLAMAVSLFLTLTQPGGIISETELPPVGKQPAESEVDSTAPAPDAEQRTTPEAPAELQAPEIPQDEGGSEDAERTQDTQDPLRVGGRVMAFWMIPPSQANP